MTDNNYCDCECLHKKETEKAIATLNEMISINDMIDFFKTFADETRLKILCILDRVKSMCVCDIAVALNMTKSAISHQLKYLKENNLIVSERKGKIVFYSLADKHVKDIFEIGIKHVEERL